MNGSEEQVWKLISRDTVAPLKKPNSSYFEYDGYVWKDCGLQLNEGEIFCHCLRIRPVT